MDPLLLADIFSFVISDRTRMHSSGMHTARLLTVSQHALWPCGGVPARPECLRRMPVGGVCLLGCLPGGICPRGGVCPDRMSAQGHVPCDLSHLAFDVTCMLRPHQLRHITSAPAYILLPGHVTCKAC